MGRVFLAEDELLRRPVAIKQPVIDATVAAAGVRMLDEARAAARVNHVGAVNILDVVHDGGTPWIVMEPLSGRTLAETVGTEGPLPVARVTHLGLRLLDALQAIHRAGVVHRDIKPSNIHICDDGRVVLTDFGIAGLIGDEPNDPVEGFVGSPPYIAPEVFHGGRPGPASDLFSFGATLFAAVEGTAPFDRGDVVATVTAVIQGAPAPFVRAGPLCPVIAGLLTTDPDQRLTAGQARNALLTIQRRAQVTPSISRHATTTPTAAGSQTGCSQPVSGLEAFPRRAVPVAASTAPCPSIDTGGIQPRRR
jgi:serine/threonine protein kinase